MTEENNEPAGTQEQSQEKEGDSPPKTEESLLSKSVAVAERMEAANKKTEELLVRQERLASENLLGGGSTAGEAEPEPKEESAKDYGKRILAGN